MKTLITKLNTLKNKAQKLDKARVSTNATLQAVIKEAGNAAAIDAVTKALNPFLSFGLAVDAIIITDNEHLCDRDLLAGYVQTMSNGKAILTNHKDKGFTSWAHDRQSYNQYNENVLKVEISKDNYTKDGYTWSCKLSLHTNAGLGNHSSIDYQTDYNSKLPKVDGMTNLPTKEALLKSYDLQMVLLEFRGDWLNQIVNALDESTEASISLDDAVDVKEITNNNFQKSIDAIYAEMAAAKNDYLKVGAIVTMPDNTYADIYVSEQREYRQVSQLEVIKVTPKGFRVNLTCCWESYNKAGNFMKTDTIENVLLHNDAVISFLDKACYVSQNQNAIKADQAIKAFKLLPSIQKIYQKGDSVKLVKNAQFKKLNDNIDNFYNDYKFSYFDVNNNTLYILECGCIWENNHRYNYEMRKALNSIAV